MISLDKCSGSYNVLSSKICFQKETKDINIKTFNMTKNRNEVKVIQSIFHVIVNANSIAEYVIQIKNGIIKRVNVNVNIIVHAKKDYS